MRPTISCHRVSVLSALLALVVLSSLAHAAFDYTFVERRGAGPYSLACTITGAWAGGAEVRLAFDYKDAQTHCYLGLTPQQASLVRISAGAVQQLAPPKAVKLGPQVEVTVQRRVGRVRAIVDGRVLLSAPIAGSLDGQVGWACSGNQVVESARLQPVDEVYFTDDFTRALGEVGQWENLVGTWTNTAVNLPRANTVFSANPFSVCAAGADGALSIAGSRYWDSYRFRASVRPVQAESVAVLGYVQDPENYIAFRWKVGTSTTPNAKQLVLCYHGQEIMLAQAPGGFRLGEWYRLELRFPEGGVEAWLDRNRVLSAQTDAFGQGRIGLWAKGDKVFFDDVAAVDMSVRHEVAAKITEGLLTDPGTVGQVNSPMVPWRAGVDGATWWHRGVFYDDVSLTVPLDPTAGQPQAVFLCSENDDPQKGYALRLQWNGPRLSLSLERDGSAIQTANAQADVEPGQHLTVEYQGRTLTVSSAGRNLVTYQDAIRPAGKQVGISASGPKYAWMSAVTSDHQLEYTFAEAPTDFYAGKGTWHITTRWPCEPRWTFFGGEADINPTVWTKHAYRGDFVAEFLMNIGMDLPSSPGYSHPSDVNMTVCGDGQRLDSGYSVILAGWRNTKTAMLRRDQVVGETNNFVFVTPTSGNEAFHRHWFRVRVERTGARVSLKVDDQPLLEYTDPDPLPDGRIALWTFHNRLMIARGFVWFAEETPAAVPDPVTWVRQELPRGERGANELFNDFENDAGEWHGDLETISDPVILALDDQTAARSRRSLKITNTTHGGPFAVFATANPNNAVRIRDLPIVSFDYRIPPNVKVNFYVCLGRVWYAVKLSADQQETTLVKLLGSFPDAAADGQWHHASFDLFSALHQLYPTREFFDARYVAFASPEEDYVQCGIGGNPMGASYWIDNFRMGPPVAQAQ